MIFRKLVIENYKSFRVRTEITFPESVNSNRNIFLIGGMNGAGKTSIMEAINYCLYGVKPEIILRNINRKEKATGNTKVLFELEILLEDQSNLTVRRSWSCGMTLNPTPRDFKERLEIEKDGETLSIQTQEIWRDFTLTAFPPAITQFFFFDGEKIQELAADDHSEIRLKTSLEAALGLYNVNRLLDDIQYIKQEERKNFSEITDADLEYKQTELKRERTKLDKMLQERSDVQEEIDEFNRELTDAKQKFQAAFHMSPSNKDERLEMEKRRVIASNNLSKVEMEVRKLCEESLGFGLLGNKFDSIKQQIYLERESASTIAIREKAKWLTQRIIQAFDEPEPVFHEAIPVEKVEELRKRIFNLLHDEKPGADVPMILNLSERDATRVLNQIESLENSEVFLIQQLLEEKNGLIEQISNLEKATQYSFFDEADKELFDKLQTDIESISSQKGRKAEKLEKIVEEIINYQKGISEIELTIEKLYEKYKVSQAKTDFINVCDRITNVLKEFIMQLRKRKVLSLQEKTFEMYRLLSNRSDQITKIEIDQDSYEVKITDRNGQQIRKSALSAGEKEVFAISLLWGLAQSSQLKLPIIIDTPLSRLDSTHRENIVNYYFPHGGEQVIILSTDTEIDNNYYSKLMPHLNGAGKLEFDIIQDSTFFKEGYFWEN